MQNNFNQPQFNGAYYQPPTDSNFSLEELSQIAIQKKAEKSQLKKTGWVLGLAIVFCILLQFASFIILDIAGLTHLYNESVVFQHCFIMLAVHFTAILIPFGVAALILKKQFVVPAIPTKRIKKSTAVFWVMFGVGACIISNYLTAFVTALFKQFGYGLSQNDLAEPGKPVEYIIMMFSTVFVPCIIEELAMRGFSLGALRKYGKGFGVVAVSVVFGLLHGNVIQFVFAFTVGLVLGYITVRTDNIIPAIIVHGLNNSLSVVQTVATNELGETANSYITVGLMGAFFVCGIIGLIGLIKQRELLPPKSVKVNNPYALTVSEKVKALIPGFIIPFLMLIALSAQTIQKL